MTNDYLIRPLDRDRLERMKKAFVTRRVPLSSISSLVEGNLKPETGDLVLARVQKLGHHTRIELCDGRRAKVFVGEEVILSYGNRYASSQFEAVVGDDLSPCHLAASGGIAGHVVSSHTSSRRPTQVEPIGLLANSDKKRLNIRDFALPSRPSPGSIPTFAVLGSSMSSGKTTTVTAIIRGLKLAGYKVGAAKITGTGSGRDYWSYVDAGADTVLDFTDAGHSSTHLVTPREVESIFTTLVGAVAESRADVAVVEIADGLFQKETADFSNSECFRKHVDGIVFVAETAMSAVTGVRGLSALSLPVIGVSGMLTCSPLAIKEFSALSDIPVYKSKTLMDPDKGAALWKSIVSAGADDRDSNVYTIPDWRKGG